MSRFINTSSQKKFTDNETPSLGSDSLKKSETSNTYSAPVKDDAPKNTDTSSNEKVNTLNKYIQQLDNYKKTINKIITICL